jgi:hypothetical protein
MSSFPTLSNMHFPAKTGEKSELNYIEKKMESTKRKTIGLPVLF